MIIYDRLIISSGGIMGYYFVGILKYLDENKLLNDIKKYYGCSIGSFLCMLITIGYTIDEIKDIIINIDKDKLLNNIDINFYLKYNCVYNNLQIALFIQKLISNKNIYENITLKEHYQKFNKKLIIVVSNITLKKCEYISYINYPNIPLWKCILMSMSIPIIFPPVYYNNNYYYDGGVYDCLPTILINENNYTKTIIITYVIDDNKDNNKLKNIFKNYKEEFNNIYHTSSDLINIFNIKNNIEYDKIKMIKNIIQNIFNLVKIYLNKFFNKKKNNNIEKFNKIYKYPYKYFYDNNINDSIINKYASSILIDYTKEELNKYIDDGYQYAYNIN